LITVFVVGSTLLFRERVAGRSLLRKKFVQAGSALLGRLIAVGDSDLHSKVASLEGIRRTVRAEIKIRIEMIARPVTPSGDLRNRFLAGRE
jgi:hypothetical protein